MTPAYIDTSEDLEDLCQRLQSAPVLAVDTEFLRERTYCAEICLIQIGAGELAACIDPLALPDLEPLYSVLRNPAIVKVLHAARQDMEIFIQTMGSLPAPVFDTQIAAGLAGYPPQIGYASIVEELLGVTLAKAHTRTNWKRRPLSADQIQYAADDVRYLAPVYEKLVAKLHANGRSDWARQDCELLQNPALYETRPDDAWQRVKGARRLPGKHLTVLRKLAAWRESTAIARNLPRRWVARDDSLMALAQSQPSTLAELAGLRGMDEKLARKHGAELLQVVTDDSHSQPTSSSARPQSPTAEQRSQVKALATITRETAEAFGIDPSLLATQKDLQNLVLGETESPLLNGWRRDQIGLTLAKVLDGPS